MRPGRVVFVIHGFLAQANSSEMYGLIDALLEQVQNLSVKLTKIDAFRINSIYTYYMYYAYQYITIYMCTESF